MVNINTVYERVLLLANKEQRGYITPDEFNSFAEQAQLEIFEEYITKKFTSTAATDTSDEYGDVKKVIEERLTYFDNTSADILVDDTGFITYPTNFYSLGMVHVIGSDRTVMADEVSHRDLNYINLSPLTKPTVKQPVYTRHEGGLFVYPKGAVNTVNLVYLRKPNAPLWAFMDDPTGEPVYDSATSVQFELSPAEEFNLVYRILTMAGIAIKQPDLAQYGDSKES